MAATGLLAAVLLPGSPAEASPSAQPSQAARADTAQRLANRLGTRSSGAYLDRGAMVVTVLDEAAAATVRAAGATPKRVTRSLATLDAAVAQLNRNIRVRNTAWAIDVASNQVVVTIADAVPAADRARVTAETAKFGGLVRVQRTPGTFRPFIAGGDEIVADQGWICSAGFNATRGAENYIVTAGHCTNGFPNWRNGNTNIGPTANSNFPVDDMGLIRNTGSAPVAGVTLHNGGIQPITGTRDAFVGENVCKSGRTTQVTCGTVTGLNATVNYGNGQLVYGLIATTARAAGGDSGGALYDGTTGLGLTSGGDSVTTFFQPLPEALARYGVALFGGGAGGRPIVGMANKCVDVRGANPADGTPVQIYDCNGTSAQQWSQVGSTLRVYGKCMDISDNGTEAGKPILLWPCTGGGNQEWQFRGDGTLYNPRSNRCLDVPNWDPANSNQLIIWDCHAGENQRWRLG